MISKLVTQRSRATLVRLSFFVASSILMSREKKAAVVILGGKFSNIHQSGEVSIRPKAAMLISPGLCTVHTRTFELGSEAHSIVLQMSVLAG